MLSFCNFSPPVFGVFALPPFEMFPELAVIFVCSLQSVVSLDKNNWNSIFFKISGVRDLGEKEKNMLEP